jgi:apolipoprotein N-acyltransferase
MYTSYILSRSRDGKLSSLLLKYFLLILSVFIGWNYFGMAFLYYVISLFKLLDQIGKMSFLNYFFHAVTLVLILQFGSIFWLFSVDKGGYGLLVNIIYYLLLFLVFYFIKLKFNVKTYSFILLWLIFEYFLNVSSFSFPWVTLGNVFSTNIYIIQWYKYTGVLGGTLWLLLLGYSINLYFVKAGKKHLFIALALFAAPIVTSLLLYSKPYPEKINNQVIATVNPALFKNQKVSKDRMAFEIVGYIDTIKPIDILVIPEQTFEGIHYKRFSKSLISEYFSRLTKKNVRTIFAGTSVIIKNKMYNGGIVIDKSGHRLKLKQKLIPYTEYLPNQLSLLLKQRSFDYQQSDSIKQIINKNKFLPLVCYESLFSFYVAKSIRASQLMVLISSESFLNGSYFGKLQYNNLIKIRCVETGSILVKASSGGKSLVIDEFGKTLNEGVEEVNYFSVNVNSLPEKTVYSGATVHLIPYILLSLLLLQIIILKRKSYQQ